MIWRARSFIVVSVAVLLLVFEAVGIARTPLDSSAPTACFDIVSKQGLAIAVDAGCSSSPTPVTYSWAWGDGSTTDAGPEAAHRYDACPGGRFDVSLTVTDETGISTTTTRDVAVADVDRDEDRLERCREEIQLTSDRRVDFDRDGINDFVESQWWRGRDAVFCEDHCSYPSATERDVYLEVDYMRSRARHPHSHRIPSSLVSSLEAEFEQNGVHLHVDQGKLGGGDVIPHDTWFSWNATKSDDADRLYNHLLGNGFTQRRRGIFHYAVVAHAFEGDTSCRIVGLGEAPTGHAKRYGDFLVIFRACLDRATNEDVALAHTLLQELGHNLFGVIEPDTDHFPCPASNAVDPFHDRYQGYAMWPYVSGGKTYHPNRWERDMNDMGKSIRLKLGARYRVNKLFSPGPGACG